MYSSVFLFVLPVFYLLGAADPARNIVIIVAAIVGRLAGAVFYGVCVFLLAKHAIFASHVHHEPVIRALLCRRPRTGRTHADSRRASAAAMRRIIAIAIIVAASATAQSQAVRVEGRFVDASTAHPVNAAVVRLLSAGAVARDRPLARRRPLHARWRRPASTASSCRASDSECGRRIRSSSPRPG